jgi:hypothetical protein
MRHAKINVVAMEKAIAEGDLREPEPSGQTMNTEEKSGSITQK